MQSLPGTEPRTEAAPASDLYGRLEAAGKIVNERLGQDDKIASISLDSMQNGGAVSQPSDFLLAPGPSWQPFTLARSLPIPDAVRHQLEGMPPGARLLMGLFAELECCWFTVHNRLILWDYVNGGNFLTYEVEDSILAMGLAPPKPGHFVPEIKHLLVIATPLKIQLLGVAVTPAQSNPRQQQQQATNNIGFYITDLECSTNGTPFHLIQASSQGRIFAAAEDDGNLYEVDYQTASGWFRSASCTLKNHTGSAWSSSLLPWINKSHSDPIIRITIDSSRHFLYTMTRSCVLELFSLGTDGKAQPSLLAKLADPFSSASLLLPNNPMLDPRNFEIVNIAALTARESKHYGLVAVTSTGVRLFFMTTQPLGGRPCLRVAHVRTPPPSNPVLPSTVGSFPGQAQQQHQQQQQQQQQPQLSNSAQLPASLAHSASYSSGGIFIAAHGQDGIEPDTLVLLSPDASRLSQSNFSSPPGFAELAGVMPIDGNARAMVEVGSTPLAQEATTTNELVTQITSPKRAFLVVTTQSLNILVKNRPIDLLSNVLEAAGENARDVQNFFNLYGREQSCAMCLALLAGPSAASALASKEVAQSLPIFASKDTSSEVMVWARRAFYELAGKPAFVPGGAPKSESLPDGRSIYFSGRHESLALHLSRLLRPVWRANLTIKSPTPVSPDRQDTAFSAKFLSAILKDLTSLKTLIDNQMDLLIAAPDQWSGAADRDALQVEHGSLASLHSLLVQAIEAFSFIILLIDHQLPNVLSTCPKDLQDQMLGLTFQGLLTSSSGREVARRIVSAIINLQISRGQSVDTVSETLQQRCGSFCSPDDVYLHKAADNMRKAKEQPSERGELLHEALQLLSQAAAQISLSRLDQLTREFRSLGYPAGAVDLALHCASVWDVEGKGLAWWSEGSPANDPRQAYFEKREDCYKTITTLLEATETDIDQAISQQNTSARQDLESQRQALFQRAYGSRDEPFNFHIYDWLMEKRRTDELLNVQSPYVERYLMRDTPSLERYDLLWQYYVRNAQYFQAAQVLSTLANSTEFGLDLGKRLEYLSLAASNARSQFPTSSGRHETQELLREAEDRLDVAQIQVDIQRRIAALPDLEDDQKATLIGRLDEQLFSVTDLYSSFAAPLQLYEVLLHILYVSDYRDPALTLEIWDGLLDKSINDTPIESQLDALEGLVIDLGRRFFPSDAVFPLIEIMTRLQKINMDYGSNSRAGWAGKTLRSASVPFDAIFESLDELFQSKTPPWHTNSSLAFLATEGILLLESWYEEMRSLRGRSSAMSFPVGDVMAAGDRYASVLPPASEAKAKWNRLAVKIGQRS